MNRSPTSQLKTITALFIILRLTLLLLYTPQGLLNAYTNYHFYYLIAQFSDQGRYPFVNMWYEYPPLSAYVPELAYRLTRAILPAGDLQSFTYLFYTRLLGCLLLVSETGVLILLHHIAALTWNVEKADWAAWVYASLSMPLLYWNTSQDAIVVFFMLLAIYAFVRDHPIWSAGALGLGIAAKLTPVFLLAPAVKWLWPRRRAVVKYGLTAGLAAAAMYAPFVPLGGAPWLAASFVALAKVSAWGTPWALLDGNWGTGYYGPLAARLDLSQAGAALAYPPVIPGGVVFGLFAVGYGLIFLRPVKDRDARHFIWFTTLAAITFHLWSKGWSPQWAVLLVPLILLSFPDSRGLRLILVFTGLIMLEWPLAPALDSRAVLAVAVTGRTALFIVIGILAGRELWASADRAGEV